MRKGISTSIIKSNTKFLDQLPKANLYELGFFESKDLETILEFFHGKSFGIHSPFVYRYADHHPMPTSLDKNSRENTFEVNKRCAELAKKIGAEYIVVHFPNTMQKENWIFLLKEAKNAFLALNEIIEVRIENVYGNSCFHHAIDYLNFLRNTKCGMCIDIGHLLIDSEIYGFSPLRFIEELSEQIVEFHIYYADLETYKHCHHAPWGESMVFHEVLKIIRDFDVDFVLEPTPDCVDGLERLFEYWRDF